MPEGLLPVLPILLLVLAAEFVNGFTDAPNAIATVVSTRVLRPHQAVIMAVGLNIVGALCGTAVAATIGKGIVSAEAVNALTIAAAMVGIVIWSTLAWVYGLPTSESHALVAGLAAIVGQYWMNYGRVMAASVLASIPAIAFFFAAQRYIVRGLVSGALKG